METTIDAVEAILKEDLPKDFEFGRREGQGVTYITIAAWPRRAHSRIKDHYPFRFEARLVSKYIAIYRVPYADRHGVGPPTTFELADPNCFKQVFSFFARELVL